MNDDFRYMKFIYLHDLCDTGAALYQLISQANWELVNILGPNFISSLQCKYMNFIHLKSSFITWMVYYKPVSSWLVSSVGKALHRYRRGHGFKSRTGLNFLQLLFSTTRFSSVLSCEVLLISFLHRSAKI